MPIPEPETALESFGAGFDSVQVEKRATAALIPYARNARTHDDAHVAQLAASIREWGWTMPVLVDEQDGIIAGHGRVLAARKLDREFVPVIVARGWPEAKKRAYILADNKLALNARWDEEMLAVELADLRGFEWGELTGFTFAEMSDIIDGPAFAAARAEAQSRLDERAGTLKCPECGHEFTP